MNPTEAGSDSRSRANVAGKKEAAPIKSVQPKLIIVVAVGKMRSSSLPLLFVVWHPHAALLRRIESRF